MVGAEKMKLVLQDCRKKEIYYSWLYCYTVGSAIGIIMSIVCPSVHLQHIMALGVGVGVKSRTVMLLAGNFILTSSDTFDVGCIIYMLTN